MSIQKDIHDIEQFLIGTLRETACSGFVLGLSGGIDSAVVAALAKRAVDRYNADFMVTSHKQPAAVLKTVSMPINSNHIDQALALDLVKSLQLQSHHIVDLVAPYNAMIDAIKGASIANNDKVFGNIKARLRMTTLYYIANCDNLLVLGTDNRSETYTGYFTKHGDGAADVFPISDFLKREVYSIAKELNIPEAIIQRPPSAGLWDGQTDEDEMGIPYDFVDNAIEGIDSLNYAKYQKDYRNYTDQLDTLHRNAQHKISPPHTFKRK